MDYSTYRLSFPDGTFYVGSTWNPNRRFTNHKHYCNNGTHYNHKLQTAWKTFGNPALQILNYYATREEAFEAEQEILNEFFGTEECLNLSSNAKSVLFTEESRIKSHSVEARKKRSATNKGKVLTEEHKVKLSLAKRGNTNGKGNAGKVRTPEHKNKISLARKENNGMSKMIMVGEITFSSFAEAGRFYGVSSSALHYALKRGNFRGMRIEKI